MCVHSQLVGYLRHCESFAEKGKEAIWGKFYYTFYHCILSMEVFNCSSENYDLVLWEWGSGSLPEVEEIFNILTILREIGKFGDISRFPLGIEIFFFILFFLLNPFLSFSSFVLFLVGFWSQSCSILRTWWHTPALRKTSGMKPWSLQTRLW